MLYFSLAQKYCSNLSSTGYPCPNLMVLSIDQKVDDQIFLHNFPYNNLSNKLCEELASKERSQ